VSLQVAYIRSSRPIDYQTGKLAWKDRLTGEVAPVCSPRRAVCCSPNDGSGSLVAFGLRGGSPRAALASGIAAIEKRSATYTVAAGSNVLVTARAPCGVSLQ